MPAEKITQLDAALHYATRGWQIFPANPTTKAPLTDNGMKDATSDTAQIRHWWTQHPDALIACRIPEDHVVLDVDPRHGGDRTWNELERSYTAIEPRRTHTSGRNDGGAHHWFKRPPGKLSARKLHEWARNSGVGAAAGERSWTSGIDILHHDHRYSILPPSPHPATGEPYLWRRKDEPGDVPGFLANLIVADEQSTERPQLRPVYDSDSIADWYSQRHSWHDLLPIHGWALVSGDGDNDGSKWRHPNASAESSASVRHGCLFVYTPNTDFEQTEDGDPRGITRFRAWAILEHHGNLSDAARSALRMRDGEPAVPVTLSDLIAHPAPIPYVGLNLPETFWATRPVLQHIRQAAHSRARSADAVFLAALARVSGLIPPTVTLPAIVGSKASLNFLGAIVSSSGGGKSTAIDVAAELVPIDRKDVTVNPMGSGEGLIESFFEWVPEEDGTGKTKKVKKQTKNAAVIYLDEGQALAEMGNRKGATLLPTLRAAWSGGLLGQANATQETHRVLQPHRYRLAILVGFQYEYAAGLIADAAGGTPQRFVFATASDPTIPDEAPEWPGQITLDIPPMIASGTTIDVNETVAAEIRKRNLAASRGHVRPDPLDSHADLVRLKVAALLALLESSLEVTADDWELAGQIMAASGAVRAAIISHSAQQAAHAERSFAVKLAHRQTVVDDTIEHRALISGAKSLSRKAHNSGGPVSKGELQSAVSSKHRKLVSVDDMIAHATEQGWLTTVLDGFGAGESRPA